MKKKYIHWFKEIGIKDVPLVGGKNASLGEMYQNLAKKGINIPNGFAVSAKAYFYLLESAGIKDKIKKILSDLDTSDMENLAERGHQVRETILKAKFPEDLEKEIIQAYQELSKEFFSKAINCQTDVAVRSSATAEDLPDASFAGQQETYLNVKGDYALLEACKKCFASLFTNRAISYRVDKGFDHFSIGLSIVVQKMIRSDKACSGVAFSIDTETGFQNAILISGSWGLGENVVQGAVNPDEFFVFKPTLEKFKPILNKKLGAKTIKMIYSQEGNKPVKNIETSEEERNKFVLNDDEILHLAKWVKIIEEYYKKPMDIEWAKDGVNNQLYIVQARPETVQSQRNVNIITTYKLQTVNCKLLCKGAAVGSKIGQGKVNVIKNVHEIKNFKKGEVLVTEITDPDWEPIMKIASAIITNKGGRCCHAAIVSRELGIPCVVGTRNATQVLKNGQAITVCCAEGEIGKVYQGIIPFNIQETNLKKFKKPKTKIMMNIGEPEQAFSSSFIPNDGIGLAREEFIINNFIKIHPNILLAIDKKQPIINNKKIDKETLGKIEEITRGYKNKSQFFVDKLAEGVSMLGAGFYPKDVIVRLSDFKSNEYANLIGGKYFEPEESNPMIGWRGASRYYSEQYKEAFALECQAIKKVREEMGLTNIIVMVPFCRTIEEAKKVLLEMKKNKLIINAYKSSANNLKIYMMVEVPSNVILAKEFAKIFDGFSIGSNDLTQLVLGVDRDSELISHVYDERNEAVKILVRDVIKIARQSKVKIGFCGQAPSDFPEFAKFLVECGIDSISLNPDSIIKTTLQISKMKK
ncbi:phosphoenolpyruvate synthase [Candidatus Kuenenbacteria bacterium HGW-Kuenenbacteria-1]|uniref:Phosphoenolpyruvate synthase n=1 Tax=Candidatus Kuenenbacteria bacterium HGW-Kuenenbacteria-1 TaxID=2013812 RepID=A0A2N1UNW6_9BACT|nr:MAG: phosphoenolpyruvate synthase [Candidatus Kuenenbacteria bacterium HGW-Kuenenbacteria-1]